MGQRLRAKTFNVGCGYEASRAQSAISLRVPREAVDRVDTCVGAEIEIHPYMNRASGCNC
jgi:hypothetical protein